jgi:phage terminase large subunit GpA-like protein
MDCVSNERVERIVCKCSSQVGKSSLLENAALYFIAADPGGSILVIQPTVDLAKAVSKERYEVMFKDTPVAQGLISKEKSRDKKNTIQSKSFSGGHINFVGANSPASLSGRSIRVVLADEVSQYKPGISKQGSPLELGIQRTETYYNRKILIASTPTTEESVLESEYSNSSRGKYNIRCIKCNELFLPEFDHVKWKKTENKEHLPETAKLHCPHCDYGHTDAERRVCIRNGQWIHERPEHPTRGFFLAVFQSPLSRMEAVVREFLKAATDTERLIKFTNTRLGRPWIEKFEKPDDIDLLNRLEPYTPDALPNDCIYCTGGIDVQGDRLELQVIAHPLKGIDECWVVDYQVFDGDPHVREVWDKAEDYLLNTKFLRQDGARIRLLSVGIDTGYATENAYAYCNKHQNRRFFPVKGASTPGNPIWPKRVSQLKKRSGQRLYIIGSDTGKTLIYRWLSVKDKDEPGYIHFPEHCCDDVYFRQLTSEKMVSKWRSGIEYKAFVPDPNENNEALDTFCYAMAAKQGIIRKINTKTIERQNLRTIPKENEKKEEKTEYSEKREEKDEKSINRKKRRINRSSYISELY